MACEELDSLLGCTFYSKIQTYHLRAKTKLLTRQNKLPPRTVNEAMLYGDVTHVCIDATLS